MGSKKEVDKKTSELIFSLMHFIYGTDLITLRIQDPKDIKLDNGLNPLMLTIIRGEDPLIDYCLMHGIDINETMDNGLTPLMFATYRGQLEVVRKLLESGANPSLEDKQGNNALMYGCLDQPSMLIQHFGSILKLQPKWKIEIQEFIASQTDLNPFLDRNEIILYLLDQEIDLNHKNKTNLSALDLYILNEYLNNLEIIDIMIQKGMNSKNPDQLLRLAKQRRQAFNLFSSFIHRKERSVIKEKITHLSRVRKQ